MGPSQHPEYRLPDCARRLMEAIGKSHRPLLISHIRLDGDAVGSELGLAHILAARGASPHVVNDATIPRAYRTLPGAASAGTSPDALRGDYDLVVALDMPSRDRAARLFERLPRHIPVVAVDHHPPVETVGDPEWKDPTISSTGEMIYRLAIAAKWHVPPDAATCLYVAVLTDTGRFSFPNTTPDALRAAARLMELGADWLTASETIYQNEPYNLMALRAEAARSMSFHAGGRLAVMKITREMLRRLKADPADLHNFADVPRSVEGVEVGVVLQEMDGKVKVSLRSRRSFDVGAVARRFDGGGHPQAAGCEITGNMEQAETLIVSALSDLLASEPKASA